MHLQLLGEGLPTRKGSDYAGTVNFSGADLLGSG